MLGSIPLTTRILFTRLNCTNLINLNINLTFTVQQHILSYNILYQLLEKKIYKNTKYSFQINTQRRYTICAITLVPMRISLNFIRVFTEKILQA